MKLFQCQVCGQALYFENTVCLRCNSPLGFQPDYLTLSAVEPADEPGLLRLKPRPGRRPAPLRYRRCQNDTAYGVCNVLVPAHDPSPLCVCCRLTRVLPDLGVPGNLERWRVIEGAKRRLFYTLAQLGLIHVNPPPGYVERLVFEFLQDQPGQQVMTGHADGLITINVAEADDDERTKRRIDLHEPYRTLLGHFRHESGHYYWDVLIRDGGRVDAWRALFGDETMDYAEALRRHYESGGRPDWQQQHVSAYATSHPWEDWAETWAHYLHMVDLLETAASFKTRMAVDQAARDESDDAVIDPFVPEGVDFDDLVARWVPLTLLVNSLNRSLGQGDAYPFALSAGAMRKLRYVHDVISEVRQQQA